MNILNRLAKRNLKLNKKRTIVTIIGIILATALITGVTTIVTSFQTSRVEHQKEVEGDYHYEFVGVPRDEIEKIAKNENVDKIFVTSVDNSYENNSEDYNNEYNVYLKFKDLDKRLDTVGTILNINMDNYKALNNIVKAENKLLDDKTKKYELNINNALIQLEGGGYRDSREEMAYYLAFIIIIVIVIISVYCIKNSFNISMSEKIREIGMLTSIGATKKQIKKEILHEAYLIGLIAIPIGLILGTLGIYIILSIIQKSLSEELFGMKFVFSLNLLSILIAIIFSIAVIYFSSIGTAIKASKVEPIEAIRKNKDIKLNKNTIKSSKFIKKIFGISGEIAYKNLKRNKRKYRTTIVSITLSIIAFIIVMSFVNYTNKINEILYGDISYDVQVYGDYKELIKIAKDSEITNNSLLSIKDASLLNYDGHVTAESNLKGTDYPSPENISIVSLGEQEYSRYIQRLGLNYEDVKDKAILYDYKLRTIEEGQKDRYLLYRVYNFKEGDYITYSINSDNEDIKSYEIEIAKIANQKPMYLVNSNTSYLIVSDEYWNNVEESVFGVESVLSIVTDNAEKTMEYIQNKFDGIYDGIVNIDKAERERKAQIITIIVFLSLFIVITTLIGVTNIFNIVTTSMELRKPEFANLKSIGMTKKEFNRMIRLETIFYCAKSLIIGIPIGLILSYILYKAFEINFAGLEFIWPISAILISIFAVLIIIGAIMKYSITRINKQNIIETLRKECI